MYIRLNQKHLRAEQYVHLRDAEINDGEVREMGQLVILPSSFTGGPPYMHETTQDAMTYVRQYGRSDLFITFTCNPNRQEIKQELLSGQQPRDRHDLIARVFKQKVMKMELLTKTKVFGASRCDMYTIEWQQRGLLHAHVWLTRSMQAVLTL